MKIRNHQQAAFAYLLLFNLGERGMERDEELAQIIEDELKPLYPTDIIFDNEGEPLIDWESCGENKGENFNYEEFIYKPNYEDELEEPQKKELSDLLTDMLDLTHPKAFKKGLKSTLEKIFNNPIK